MIDYLPWAIAHLGALALILLCAAGFGNLFLRKHRFDNLAERSVFTVSLGLGLCALVLFILGLLGILYQSLIWVLTVAGAVATVWHWLFSHRGSLEIRQWRQVLRVQQWRQLYTLRHAITALLIFLGVSCWLLLLIKSQYPPHNWDSTSNHLVIARANLTEHRLVVVPGIPFPVVPLLDHMLFTWAMALKDDVLAQMVVHVFLMLTAFGLYAWGKRLGRPAVGGAAAALWLAHPLIQELGSTAYVDISLTCFVFLGVYALRIFWDDRKTQWWYLGSALFALAAGTKITGLFFVGFGSLLGLIGFAFVFLKNRRKPSEEAATSDGDFNGKSLLIGWAITLLLVIPWFAYSAYETGNPLWPFFPQYSKGIWGNAWLRGYMSGYIRGMNQAALKQFFLVYLDFIRYPARFDAENNLTLLPVIVAWPLAWIVAFFNRSVRWWVLWALAFTVFWYLQVPAIRYWIPVLPFAGLALCESIQWVMEKTANVRSLHNAVWVTVIVVLLLWSSYGTAQVVSAELPPATPQAREAWLQRLNGYPGVKYINDHAKNTDTVCVLSASWLNYYFNQRVIDLRGSLYGFRKPTFKWPNDQLWTEWMAYENVEWLLVYYQARELDVPKQDPSTNPFWPNYQLVFANHDTWVFRRKKPN